MNGEAILGKVHLQPQTGAAATRNRSFTLRSAFSHPDTKSNERRGHVWKRMSETTNGLENDGIRNGPDGPSAVDPKAVENSTTQFLKSVSPFGAEASSCRENQTTRRHLLS